VKIALGTFACRGVETHLGSDVATGAQAALAEYVRKIRDGVAPAVVPRFALEAAEPAPATAFELTLDEQTWTTLELEAARQGTSLSRLAAHSVLVYLAELDRLQAG
jgi:hypothetical protein